MKLSAFRTAMKEAATQREIRKNQPPVSAAKARRQFEAVQKGSKQ